MKMELLTRESENTLASNQPPAAAHVSLDVISLDSYNKRG